MSHGELMLRPLPKLCLGLVATRASFAPDKCRFGAGNGRRRCSAEFASAELKKETDGKHGSYRHRQHGKCHAQRESFRPCGGGRGDSRSSCGLVAGSALLRRRLSSLARQRCPFSVQIVNIERSVLSERD